MESCGKTARQLEWELGIGKTSLSRWKRELEEKGKQAFPGQGHIPLEQERIQELETGRDPAPGTGHSKKAVAIFAHPSR